jgi:hypothetical protein
MRPSLQKMKVSGTVDDMNVVNHLKRGQKGDEKEQRAMLSTGLRRPEATTVADEPGSVERRAAHQTYCNHCSESLLQFPVSSLCSQTIPQLGLLLFICVRQRTTAGLQPALGHLQTSERGSKDPFPGVENT